jgi:thiosulfate dehydrogenase
LLAGALALVFVPAMAQHGPGSASDPTVIWRIARGGQLYDNWMAVISAKPPKGNHPAYPKSGKRTGAATWRCSACHGWDYKGVDGAFGKGRDFTGIVGVRGVVGKKPKTIERIILNKTHAYAGTIPRPAVQKLALFLSLGQLDMDRFISRRSRKTRGGVTRNGARFYQTICALCHGFDGKKIDTRHENRTEYAGTVCVENPWKALHKIRFGQPGVPMVALISLDIEDLVDILAYCQLLPTK